MDFTWAIVRLLLPLTLSIWVDSGPGQRLLVSAGSTNQDAYLLLADHFTQHGRSSLPRDLIRQARSLKQDGGGLPSYPADRHAKRPSKETLSELESLIETLASAEHPDLLADEGQVDTNDERVCSGENLARLRRLAEAMRSGYRWQMRHDAGGKFLFARPCSLTRAIRDLTEETRARCLPKYYLQISAALDSLEANYGESLNELAALAHGELEREYERFSEEHKACEWFDVKAQRALAGRQQPEWDQVALGQIQGALAEVHKRRTNGQPLERVHRRTNKPLKLTRADLAEYLRAYLLDPCRELLDDPVVGSLKPATDILLSDFIVAATRHPMPPASTVPFLGDHDKQPQLTWPLRLVACERLVRTGELELAKHLTQYLGRAHAH